MLELTRVLSGAHHELTTRIGAADDIVRHRPDLEGVAEHYHFTPRQQSGVQRPRGVEHFRNGPWPLPRPDVAHAHVVHESPAVPSRHRAVEQPRATVASA